MQNRIIIILILFLSANSVFAASPKVFFDIPNINVNEGEEIILNVKVSSEEVINAIDIQIKANENILPTDLSEVNSIIKIWQDKNIVGNSIYLKGGMINPFSGENGQIIKIKFLAKKSGNAQILFANSYLYFADGLGTRIQSGFENKTFIIGEKVFSENNSVIDKNVLDNFDVKDNTLPELFAKIDTELINNKKIITFFATDNESGIKKIEVRYKKFFIWSDWKEISVPDEIPNGTTKIQIDAINGAGLTTTVLIDNSGTLLIFTFFITIIIFILIIFTLVRRIKSSYNYK